mmetsp:Transcript_7924/g.15422  ORF Transcript_7924/g.15422 Transcript_7924/m.15422 type:complete len:241 (-) Transcript_7924:211-933(-)|eukprot:CAMPEP_0175074622 /NCGR_PEP_ID=MMETSP0052_2-20121109/21434_1 /TAXON_ID=51329 ORGANISM="Polytomella parva, Strain SAG 63-3" /NCGR_SAMPLE_ID=MMETSP0052_2 /ASSEMBLY_ACC=CAM_ASM_000194 /LENGTH=240 /DNA_ID=CAMNT_0016342991 /DNA_START=21 /DNA_END=743 /DNA_ORIENTATION=+
MDGKLDAKAFGQAMNSIAYAQTVKAAVRDYKKEVLDSESKQNQQDMKFNRVDIDELISEDAELQKLHAERIASMQKEHEKRAEMKNKGHGTYSEITESEFLEVVTKSEYTLVHFFHRDFEKCKIMDKHLSILSSKYFDTRFVKLSAPDSPFFTVKLQVKALPCLVFFKNGVTTGRQIGFEGLGRDDFPTHALESHLLISGVIQELKVDKDSIDETDAVAKGVRRSSLYKKTDSDEDSDFD